MQVQGCHEHADADVQTQHHTRYTEALRFFNLKQYKDRSLPVVLDRYRELVPRPHHVNPARQSAQVHGGDMLPANHCQASLSWDLSNIL